MDSCCSKVARRATPLTLSSKPPKPSRDSSIQYELGKAALAVGNRELAEKSFLQATELNPAERGAQEELARIACLRGDIGLLSDVADSTIDAMPGFSGGYVWRAIVEMDRNLPAKAEADLKTAMDLAPQSSQPYLHLGKLRLPQKRFPEGVGLLDRALQNQPQFRRSHALAGQLRSLSETAGQRARSREGANRKEPREQQVLRFLAQLQFQSGKLDQAAATTQKAIQLNPDDGDAVLLFANTAERGKIDNAIAAWEQQSNAHPTTRRPRNSRNSQGIPWRFRQGRSLLRKSLQIQPQQPIAANNLAYRMLMNSEKVNTALALAQTARQGMPDSPNTADTLAWAYYCNGLTSLLATCLRMRSPSIQIAPPCSTILEWCTANSAITTTPRFT